MINLSIAAVTTDELHEKLKGILYGLAQAPDLALQAATFVNAGKIAILEAQQGVHAAGTANVDDNAIKPKATRGKKADEPRQETVAETRAEAAKQELHPNQEQPDTQPPTLDDLRAALMSLSKAEGHGSEAVFKLLETFNAKNASTVREDQRALVIAAVKQKLEPAA